ncbi:MAG: hypothetical protein Q8O67_04990 [Deltaproteobacteria bacterium]|nr:hypothetical protein [Deltaproteobacteria bacterium]
MQLRTLLGTTVGALLLSTGCMVDRTYQPEPSQDFRDGFVVDNSDLDDDFNDDDFNDDLGNGDGQDLYEEEPSIPFVGVRNGLMSGDVGPAVGINQTPDRLAVYDDGYYLSIEAVAQLDNRAAMLMLSASNAGDLFTAGTSRTFSFYAYEADGAQVYLLGCTGPEMDVYDEFDVPADEVDVVVEEAPGGEPGEVLVQLTGRWNQYDDQGEIFDVKKANSTFTLRQ